VLRYAYPRRIKKSAGFCVYHNVSSVSTCRCVKWLPSRIVCSALRDRKRTSSEGRSSRLALTVGFRRPRTTIRAEIDLTLQIFRSINFVFRSICIAAMVTPLGDITFYGFVDNQASLDPCPSLCAEETAVSHVYNEWKG